MTVGVMGSLRTGGPTEVVGDTRSCELNDPFTSVVQPATVEVGKNTGGGLIVSKGHIVIAAKIDLIVGVGCLAGGIITGSGCSIGIVAGGDFTVISRVWIQV